MLAVKLILPSICEEIYSYIFEATIFDIFPLDIVYDAITGTDIVEVPTEELELVGYDSVTAIRNIGSLFLIITWTYSMISLLKCFSYCLNTEHAPCQKSYHDSKRNYNINTIIQLTHANYLVYSCVTFIYLRY